MTQAALRGALLLTLFAAAAAGAHPLRVDLDSRLELEGAVRWLAAPASTSTQNPLAGSAYARDLTARFSAPADPELRSPRPQWTSADRARFMLSLSPVPELERLDAVEYSNVERAGGAEELERWLAALREFARASKFDAAFNASRYLLDPDAVLLRKRLAAEAPLTALAQYTGLGLPGQTTLLLSPFQASGPAPGYVKVLDDGSVSVTMVIGLSVSTAAAPVQDFWSDRLPAALWNELAQIQLEPLAALYADRIAQSSATVKCPSDLRRCVEEQIARAVTLRLVARGAGADAAKKQREGFEGDVQNPMLTALLAGLERYEKSRPRGAPRGAGLADYYPKLLAALPLNDPGAAPAPPRLPPSSDLPPAERRRLASFLKDVSPTSRDPRLRALAAAAGDWARATPGEASPPRAEASASAADELRRQGLEKFDKGQAQAALDDLQASLSTAPLDAQTLASKAAILSTLGRDDESLIAYASALESARAEADSSSLMLAADILSSRATILERRANIAEAVSDLEDALRTAPPEWPRRKDARSRLKALKARPRRGP